MRSSLSPRRRPSRRTRPSEIAGRHSWALVAVWIVIRGAHGGRIFGDCLVCEYPPLLEIPPHVSRDSLKLACPAFQMKVVDLRSSGASTNEGISPCIAYCTNTGSSGAAHLLGDLVTVGSGRSLVLIPHTQPTLELRPLWRSPPHPLRTHGRGPLSRPTQAPL